MATVFEEGLQSAADRNVISTACSEDRCLVTLDLEFWNPILFPPQNYAGIVVVRLRATSIPEDLVAGVLTLLRALAIREVKGKLWIVQGNRLREYHSE